MTKAHIDAIIFHYSGKKGQIRKDVTVWRSNGNTAIYKNTERRFDAVCTLATPKDWRFSEGHNWIRFSRIY